MLDLAICAASIAMLATLTLAVSSMRDQRHRGRGANVADREGRSDVLWAPLQPIPVPSAFSPRDHASRAQAVVNGDNLTPRQVADLSVTGSDDENSGRRHVSLRSGDRFVGDVSRRIG